MSRTKEVTVSDLFNELKELTDDPFGQLKELVHGHDLPLRAAEYGYIGEHYGVGGATPAIIIATRENDIKADNATVEITTGNDRYLWPLHKLYVRRHEVEEIIMRDKDMSFLKLDAEGNLTMRPTEKAQAPQAPDDGMAQASSTKSDGGKSKDRLEVFRDMKLMSTEVTLDLAPGDMIWIKARKAQKRITFGEFGLIDGRSSGKLNNQAKLLIDLAAKKPMPEKNTEERDAYLSAVKAVRKIFKDRLGVKSGSFSEDWKPHFKITDSRNRADLRAEEKALKVQAATKKRQAARRKQAEGSDHDLHDPEQYSTSNRCDDESHEDPFRTLLLDKVKAKRIPEREINKMTNLFEQGKITMESFEQWLDAY